jgi:hypothetical protein
MRAVRQAVIQWTEAEDGILKRLLASGMGYHDCARTLGCTSGAIQHRRRRLGLGNLLTVARTTSRREAHLRRNWKTNTVTTIASRLKIPPTEVLAIAARIGLRIEDNHVPKRACPEPAGTLAASKSRLPHWCDAAKATWACNDRHIDRQAALVWDMVRAHLKRKPIGKGYA